MAKTKREKEKVVGFKELNRKREMRSDGRNKRGNSHITCQIRTQDKKKNKY